MTTMQLLFVRKDPCFSYWEWHYLRFLRRMVTENWHRIQRGVDPVTDGLWNLCLDTVELDRRARFDLFLLAASGIMGRCEANRIMWLLLAEWAPVRPYKDLSKRVTSACNEARRQFDRPPNYHADLPEWTISCYTDERVGDPWHPYTAPPDLERMTWVVGQNDEPLQPPECWRPKGGPSGASGNVGPHQ